MNNLEFKNSLVQFLYWDSCISSLSIHFWILRNFAYIFVTFAVVAQTLPVRIIGRNSSGCGSLPYKYEREQYTQKVCTDKRYSLRELENGFISITQLAEEYTTKILIIKKTTKINLSLGHMAMSLMQKLQLTSIGNPFIIFKIEWYYFYIDLYL